MRQKDKVEKLLEDYPDVFADIINVLIYDGKQVISPKQLSETKVRSQYKAADSTLHEQERDILKVWKKGKDHKVIFGIENQTSTDKQMSFRVMGYDGASYRSQLNDDEDKKELCEVVTLILYFGNGRWNTSKELRDTFAKKGNVEKYANNYKLNVFEIAYLTEEQIKHVDEMLKFMEIFAEDERFLKLNLEKKKKGAITMCTILDAAEERGVNRGETLKLIMLVQKKARKGDSIAKIADDLVEDEIVISPIYKMVKEYPEDTERDIYQRLN